MKLLALYWGFLAASYIAASKLRKTSFDFSWVQPSMMVAIYIMCTIMGMRMGINEQVTSNLGSIGIMSLIVTAFCIAGSMVMVFLMRKIFGMDRYGDVKKKIAADTAYEEQLETTAVGEPKKLELKSTFLILGVVAGGMLIGALILVPYCSSQLAVIEKVSWYFLVVMLCILLALVGLDLGSTGNIVGSFRNAGIKIIIFPIAAVIGTTVAGTITCIIMGFSLREASAISMGFGWYTYAPVVIGSAGTQFAIASAVSFMHNVMREMAGIIGIPFFARTFGYLEATVVPGAAAMDVCMPIVERSCKQDTVIYSFVTGLFMTLVTSVTVPLIMGV